MPAWLPQTGLAGDPPAPGIGASRSRPGEGHRRPNSGRKEQLVERLRGLVRSMNKRKVEEPGEVAERGDQDEASSCTALQGVQILF